MPDLTEGLESGGDQEFLDVNTEAGFLAAISELATGAAAPEEAIAKATEEERSISAGLEVTEEPTPQERARDEQGRFAAGEPETPAPEEATPPAGEDGAAAEQQPLHENPEIATYLEQYGGDIDKALEAGRHAQRKIGEQGNEMGQLREQLAELRGMVQAGQQQQPPSAAPAGLPVVDNATYEWIEESIAQVGGASTLARVAETNDPNLIETAISLWEETDDPTARAVRTRWEVRKAMDQYAPQQAPAEPEKLQLDPYLQQVALEKRLQDVVGQISSSMSEAEWGLVKEHIVPVLQDESTSGTIKNMVFSEDPNVQVEGMNIVAQLAAGRAIKTASAGATQQAAEERTATAVADKQRAQVATGSLRPAGAEGQSGEGEAPSKEEITKQFHKLLLETPTASVSEGLTYGSK